MTATDLLITATIGALAFLALLAGMAVSDWLRARRFRAIMRRDLADPCVWPVVDRDYRPKGR